MAWGESPWQPHPLAHTNFLCIEKAGVSNSSIRFKVNQQNVVYYCKCGLCDTDYVGFTSRHLHQRVEKHKRATIGYHIEDEYNGDPDSIGSNFEILKKCQSKLDCLIFEMLFICKLKPKLNEQSDSIRAKLFTKRFFIIHSCHNFLFFVCVLFLCKYFRVLASTVYLISI